MYAATVEAKSVDLILGSITSTVKSAVSVTNTVCIQMPKRAILFYLTLQKELFLLPFRVGNKVFEALVKNPLSLLFKVYERVTEKGPDPVEILTGEKNPSTQKIHQDFLEVRKAALKVIKKENRTRWQMQMYRKELENWNQENERKTEEMYKIGREEKELLKAVAAALSYLKSLKLKREKMSDYFSENLKTMLEEGTISSEKLLRMQRKIKSVDIAIKEKKDACLNLLKQSVVHEPLLTDLRTNIWDINENAVKKDNAYPQETVKKILDMMSDENAFLKEKLSASQETLELILDVSSSINDRIIMLANKLSEVGYVSDDVEDLQRTMEHERELLRKAEADRDILKEKLDTLESMIKEEETYLGDMITLDSMYEDSDYSSISGASEDHPTSEQTTITC